MQDDEDPQFDQGVGQARPAQPGRSPARTHLRYQQAEAAVQGPAGLNFQDVDVGLAAAYAFRMIPLRLAGIAAIALAASVASSLPIAWRTMAFAEVGRGGERTLAVPGEESDAELDELFRRLAGAEAPDEAEAIEQRILRSWARSGSPTVDLLMARAAEAIDGTDFGLAHELLDTVVTLAPDYAEGWNRRATLYYLIDEFQLSIADISRVLALEPRHFGALSGLGLILSEIGEEKQALEAYRRALDIHPFMSGARKAADELSPDIDGHEI